MNRVFKSLLFLGSLLCFDCGFIVSETVDDNGDGHGWEGQAEGHDGFIDDWGDGEWSGFFGDFALQFEFFDEDCGFACSLDEEVGAQQKGPGEGQVRDNSYFAVFLQQFCAVHVIDIINCDGWQRQEAVGDC